MKKRLMIIILIITFFLIDTNIASKKKEIIIEKENIKAIYISYIEYLDNFLGNSKTINETKIKMMIDNISEIGFNTIFLHVSPFSDSIYNSKILPYSYTLTGTEDKNPGFDYLDYFIKIAHLKKIKVHAWINPYRIRSDNKKELISEKNPAYKLLNTNNILISKNGIYYNPSSEIVKELVISEIEEIINNYQIDGIHFDDYFYSDKNIDKIEYNNYLDNGNNISLLDYHLMQTNDLIKRVYELIKLKNSNIIFSIAPDGNINNNYLYHYADVKKWLSNNNYIDIIMPQIYYGFENEYLSFNRALDNWKKINVNNTRIIPVLAFYKSGFIDNDAGSGKNEWIKNDNIISKQINVLKENGINEYALFRYDYLFNNDYLNKNSKKELEKLK